MNFDDFLAYAPKIAKQILPGEEAQLKMAPPERKDLMRELDLSGLNPRSAAVLMLIYPVNNKATLALILRNSYKGVHSSQVAFPGGKVESYDSSTLHAALRETEEEVGVAREIINVVCPFSTIYIPPSNFRVAPFLAFCNHTPQFIPDPREVAGMIAMPLADLLDDQNVVVQPMATSYSVSIDVPSYKIGGHHIWGATAMMLSEFKEVLKTVALPL